MNPGILSLLKKNWKIALLTILISFLFTIAIAYLFGFIGCPYLTGIVSAMKVPGFGKAAGNNQEIASPGSTTSNPNDLDYPGAEPEDIKDCLDQAIQSISKNSPLKGEWFARAGKNHNINPAFLIAIANKETSLANNGIDYTQSSNHYINGKRVGGRYNIGNINNKSGDPIFIDYNSFEDGIEGLAAYLDTGYFNYTGTGGPVKDLRGIAYIYCPPKPDQFGNACDTEKWIQDVTNTINRVYDKCPNMSQNNQSASVQGTNILAILNYASTNNWKQTGPTDCYIACDKLWRDTFKKTPVIGYNDFNLDTVTDIKNEPPTQSDLSTLRSHLDKDQIVFWNVKGENGGGHWIIVTNIDENNNITFLDPNGGAKRVLSYDNYVKNKNWYFFARTDKYSDAGLRGTYRLNK